MNIQFMEMLQQGSKGSSGSHLGKGVHVLREALATITELAVRTGDVGVGIVDVAGEEDAGVDLAPIGTHLLAVLAACVEVGHLIRAEDIVHILGKLGLQRSHDGELLPNENLGKKILGAGEYHCLFFEVLDKGALREEFRHIAHLVSSLFGQHLAGAGKNGGTDENRDIRQLRD